MQTNLAITYQALGRFEHSLQLEWDIYHGSLRLLGEEHGDTLISVNNLVNSLCNLQHFEEAKSLLRNWIPVARRVRGKNCGLTLRMRMLYAHALCRDANATLDDLRESVETLAKMERNAGRVFGAAHPLVATIARCLRNSRAALDARETSCTCVPVPPPPS